MCGEGSPQRSCLPWFPSLLASVRLADSICGRCHQEDLPNAFSGIMCPQKDGISRFTEIRSLSRHLVDEPILWELLDKSQDLSLVQQ